MSAEEFNEAGLDKLSDEELARLGAWFRDNRDKAVTQTRAEVKAEVKAEVEAEVAAAAAAQPAAKPEKPPEEFTARARGFAGWAGKTVFALDNGQVWRQRMPGKFNYSGSANEVKFDKNFMGGWVMEHVESGRTVLVELID
ncbi:hypothetical protein [Marinihelvus fidelis]|nr:hypothetical protein [Marinihelvus fidelis]